MQSARRNDKGRSPTKGMRPFRPPHGNFAGLCGRVCRFCSRSARRFRLARACSKRQRSGRLRSHAGDGLDTGIMAMTRRRRSRASLGARGYSIGRFDEADFGFAGSRRLQQCVPNFFIAAPSAFDGEATVWRSTRLSRPGPDGIPIVSRMSRIVMAARSSIRRFCQLSR